MSRFLHRLGGTAARHPWRTLAAGLALTLTVLGLALTVGGTTQDDYDVPGIASRKGQQLLAEHLPASAHAFARVVVHDPDGGTPDPAVLDDLSARLSGMDHVAAVAPPTLSADGDTAIVMVSYGEPVTHPDLMGNLTPLEDAVAPTRDAGYQVELGGDLPDSAAAPINGQGELIGVTAALVVLVLTFGSVVAAGLPVAIALAGLGVGGGGVLLLAAAMDVSNLAPTVATMVGLGVGIDYALLMVSRHVEYLRRGLTPVEAAARASATAGRSIVVAAATVLVSLLGLRLAGLPTYDSFGFATAISVLAVMLAALTLVPVLCRFAGYRLLPRRERRARKLAAAADTDAHAVVTETGMPSASPRATLTGRWAARVGRRPLPWAIGAALIVLTLAVPALDMRIWPQDPGGQSTQLTTRRAYDLMAQEFGEGANGRMVVVVDHGKVPAGDVARLAEEVVAHEDVVAVSTPFVSPDGAVSVFEATPAFGPTDERTPALVEDVRTLLPEGAELTGLTPVMNDIAAKMSDRLPLVIGFVVGVSVLFLTVMFRSVVVPLKAAVMNLLSVAAAYGVVTAVFQWGWGVELFGLDHAIPVSSWVPILLFAILFGLSMDYEVFLLSRIREDWQRTGDPRGSVVRGLASTGRVISAAAAIMVAVFLGFATEVDVVVKMMGLGMAVAVLLDATLVRMVLVPATMAMLGRWNWWLPRWLDRILPEIRLEVDDDAIPAPAPTRPELSPEPAAV